MFKFIENYLVNRSYKRMNKLLNETQSGESTNSSYWKGRAIYCEELLNKQEKIDKITSIALNLVIKECEMMEKLCEANKVAEYLVDFEKEKGYDTFIQTSDPKFADEFRIYRNKSKITVVKDGKEMDYNTSSWSPGKHYEYKENNVDFTINLISQPIKKININIATEENSENLLLDLKQK